jgi:phosphopentomutase
MAERDALSILHSAFSFIKGVESNRATAAITLDHLIEEQIKSLKSGEVRDILDGQRNTRAVRTSRWDELDALEKQMSQVIQDLK